MSLLPGLWLSGYPLAVVSYVQLTAAAASITLPGNSQTIPAGYSEILAVLSGRTNHGGSATVDAVQVVINGDAGNDYQYTGLGAYISGTYNFASGLTSALRAGLLPNNAASPWFGTIYLRIRDYSDAVNYKAIDLNCSCPYASGSQNFEVAGGAWMNAAAVTSLTFSMPSGSDFEANTSAVLYLLG